MKSPAGPDPDSSNLRVRLKVALYDPSNFLEANHFSLRLPNHIKGIEHPSLPNDSRHSLVCRELDG